MGEMSIEGDRAALRLDGFGRVFIRPFGQTDEMLVLGENHNPEFGGGCVGLLNAHIAQALRTGSPIENRLDDYLPVLQACEAAYMSLDQKRQITIGGMQRP